MSYGPPPPPPPQYPYQGGAPGWPPPMPVQEEGQATTALVLGILGVALCQLIAPFALVIGRNSMKAIDASGGQLGGRSKAQAGFILGIVGTALIVLAILGLLLLVAVGTSSSTVHMN